MKYRLLQIAIVFTLIIMVATGIALIQTQPTPPASQPAGVAVAGAPIGGDFTLTNHLGERVSEADFSGQFRLVYFGFTHCPDVCPIDVAKIAQALKLLDDRALARTTGLFITIDPSRDTPETMRNYVELFHPRIVGLTGSHAEISQVMDQYKVYAAKVEDPAYVDYIINHSSYIYLIGPDGEFIDIFGSDDGPEALADRITSMI